MTALSVIIPTYNRAAALQTCLHALAQQTLPPADFEVLVVVDGSTDATRTMLAELAVPYPLRVCWQANAGQCAARNHGAAQAAGRWLLFLDDDVVAAPTLLAAHLAAQTARAGVGLGRLDMHPPPAAGAFVRSFAQMWNTHYDRLAQRPAAWRDCYSGNLALPRAAFLAVGGFALDLPAAFDIELGYRLEQHGLLFTYVPAAAGEHRDYKSFEALAADEEKQGRAAVEIGRRHPAMRARLLGGFDAGPLHVALLRRLLLALNIGPRWLRRLSRLAANQPWEDAWYLFLHGYFYWRGVRQALPDRAAWRRLTYRTPILMYHAFGGPGEPASRFVVPRWKFALQMAWLKWGRYHVLSLEDYVRAHQAGELPPARSVVITIDDGFADTLTHAYPILQRHGFPATVFMVSGAVGGVSRWDKTGPLVGRPLLAWPALLAMARGGVTLGAHTRTHPQLTTLSREQAAVELAGSRADLEAALGRPVRLLAYPFGDHDAQIEQLAAQAGFEGACSVHRGPNTLATPRLALCRTEVEGTDSLVRFGLGLLLGDHRLPPRRRAPRARAAPAPLAPPLDGRVSEE